MITVRFLGGAVKSFPAGSIMVERDGITIAELLEYLVSIKPQDAPELDTANILVAINGADSSAVGGRAAVLHGGDTITIIPVIHGGAARLRFTVARRNVEVLALRHHAGQNATYLDGLRAKFPGLILQAVSKRFVLGKSHIQKILLVSLGAKKEDVMLSKKLEMDILMRFAGTGRISQAILTAGADRTDEFVLIAIGAGSALDRLYRHARPLLIPRFTQDNEKFLMREFKIPRRQLLAADSKTPLEDILAERAAVLL